MNKMNIKETIKYLEQIINVRLDSIINGNYEIEEKLRNQADDLLEKQTLLDLLIIKTTTESLILKADVEEEIKRRVKLAKENND